MAGIRAVYCIFVVISIVPSRECGTLPCTNMKQLHGYQINITTSCLQFNYNETGDWMDQRLIRLSAADSQRLHAAIGDRVVWLGNLFGIVHLQTSFQAFHQNVSTFWKNQASETPLACGNSKRKLCFTKKSSFVCTPSVCTSSMCTSPSVCTPSVCATYVCTSSMCTSPSVCTQSVCTSSTCTSSMCTSPSVCTTSVCTTSVCTELGCGLREGRCAYPCI